MVADMTSAKSFCCNWCSLLIMSAISAGAGAQILPDPTRPPDEIFIPANLQSRSDSGLQSVIISPTRHTAIINGQTVEQGEMLGNARLVEVNESYVVLRSAEGRQVLSMFNGVEIKKAGSTSSSINAAAHESNKHKSGGKRMRHVTPAKSDGEEGK